MLIDLILAVIAILVTGVVFNVIGNIASREN